LFRATILINEHIDVFVAVHWRLNDPGEQDNKNTGINFFNLSGNLGPCCTAKEMIGENQFYWLLPNPNNS